MAAMLQHSPMAPRAQQHRQHKETPDFMVNNYTNGKKRFNQNQEPWSYPHDWQPQPFNINAYQYSYQPQYPPPHMYPQHRPRTQSNPTQPQKSSSTPQRQQRHRRPSNNTNESTRRPKSMVMIPPSRPMMPSASSSNRSISTADSGRRSSITSTSSNLSQSFSIRSEMSMGTKLSLSKRLRKVFSVSSLRSSPSSKSLGSLGGASSSNVSIATVDMIPEEIHTDSSASSPITPSTPPQRSLRRRSLASLTNLFNKSTPAPPPSSSHSSRQPSIQRQSTDKKDRPSLRVDTTQASISLTTTTSTSSTTSSSSTSSYSSSPAPTKKKAPCKGRSPVIAPDSPNSGISTRSPFTRPTGPHRLASELPSPTPSSLSSSDNEINSLVDQFGDLSMAPPPVIGVHYGLPMHGSPRLKPAASSSSSSLMDPLPANNKRRLQFCPTVQVHETFAAADYDRRCDTNATCQKLTPALALKIKQEMNEYKLTEMDVHIDSRQYTQFFL
ncbi:hypothetical protein BC941DRAFT_466261 [Chlamydoabsidia padenii]|nr:hypothetical protein BC941DRAFT_466261 [Chlamydoabsidia padenii]